MVALRNMALLVFTLTSLAVLVPGLASAASPALGQVIHEIRVQGNEKVETEAVLDNISIREGDILRAESVAQAIKDIYRLRYFRHVRVEYEQDEGGIVLLFITTEKPAVREVIIDGNKKVTTDDIKDVMTIRPFSILDNAKVKATVRKIEDLYLEKGFFLAEVSTKVERGSGNEVVIRFDITENKKVLVKKINLVGNKELSDLFIKQRLQTKGAGILPGLGETGTYRRETLETDAEIMVAHRKKIAAQNKRKRRHGLLPFS